jgi:hypothetical protein
MLAAGIPAQNLPQASAPRCNLAITPEADDFVKKFRIIQNHADVACDGAPAGLVRRNRSQTA